MTESFSAASGSVWVSMKTGMTMVPMFLSSALRIARPTACTMSTSARRGSMNATPSSVGTSTPSARHLALVKQTELAHLRAGLAAGSADLAAQRSFHRRCARTTACLLDVAERGIHAITSGMEVAKSRARFTREWNEMVRRSSYFRIALASPIWPARVAAFGPPSSPSRVTSTPSSAHSRYVASSTPTMATR